MIPDYDPTSSRSPYGLATRLPQLCVSTSIVVTVLSIYYLPNYVSEDLCYSIAMAITVIIGLISLLVAHFVNKFSFKGDRLDVSRDARTAASNLRLVAILSIVFGIACTRWFLPLRIEYVHEVRAFGEKGRLLRYFGPVSIECNRFTFSHGGRLPYNLDELLESNTDPKSDHAIKQSMSIFEYMGNGASPGKGIVPILKSKQLFEGGWRLMVYSDADAKLVKERP